MLVRFASGVFRIMCVLEYNSHFEITIITVFLRNLHISAVTHLFAYGREFTMAVDIEVAVFWNGTLKFAACFFCVQYGSSECHHKSVFPHIRRQHCAFVSDIVNDLLRRIGTSCWWRSQHKSIQSHRGPVRVHYFKRRHFEMLWMVRENLRALSRVSDAWLFLYVDSCCVTSDWRKETKASRQATGSEVITLTVDHPVCH